MNIAEKVAGVFRNFNDEIETLVKERDEAREWVKRLQKTTQTLTCVYCGQEYPPNTPAHGSEVLTEHIKVCKKHPMRKLEKENADLRKRILELEIDYENLENAYTADA